MRGDQAGADEADPRLDPALLPRCDAGAVGADGPEDDQGPAEEKSLAGGRERLTVLLCRQAWSTGTTSARPLTRTGHRSPRFCNTSSPSTRPRSRSRNWFANSTPTTTRLADATRSNAPCATSPAPVSCTTATRWFCRPAPPCASI